MTAATDTIVIGAGIIGASIAWRLASAGMRVTLIDAGKWGAEASSAGAGMLAPGGEIDGDSPWVPLSLESLRMYPDFVDQLRDETGEDIDYRKSGAVEIARTANQSSEITARALRQKMLGIESEEISGAVLTALIPGLPDIPLEKALYYPGDAVVHPHHVLHALRVACEARRVCILEHKPVREIGLGADRVWAEYEDGRLEAQFAVLAAGAWSTAIPIHGRAEAAALPAAFPVKGHMIGRPLPPGCLGPIVRSNHTYIFQRESGYTLTGSTMEQAGFDRSVDPRLVEDLAARGRDILPGLLAGAPTDAWAGLRPGIEGGEPQVRRLGDTNLWLAYGHFRNGILLAPVTSRIIAEGISENRPAASQG